MTLQTSGPISFTNIVDEFGSAPVKKISSYYGLDEGIPNSGQIKFSDFYGKMINATRTIIATTDFNARSDFINASIVGGYKTATTVFSTNQKVKYYLTVNGVVNSSSTLLTAFDTGNFPLGSFLYLTNNSYIIGAGGNGGNNDQSGSSGGSALTLNLRSYITNNGTIAGGGGGGAGGNSTSDSRCKQDSCCHQTCYTANATGGGGGGGAGYVAGSGGTGGSGQAGSGTFFTGGGGGGGVSSSDGNASTTSGGGGNGGDLGSEGDDAGGGQGGSAGNYIVNNDVYATWIKFGTRLGGVG